MMLIQKISLVKAQYLSPYPLTSNILLSLCMQYVLLLCFNNKWKEQRNSRAVDWNNRTRTELEFETELNFDFSPSCCAKPKPSIFQMLSLLNDECWVYLASGRLVKMLYFDVFDNFLCHGLYIWQLACIVTKICLAC